MVHCKRLVTVALILFTSVANSEESAVINVPPPAEVKQLMSARCQPCHFELRVKPSLLLNTNKWFRMTEDNFEIERRVFLESPPHSMPMDALLDERERAMLRGWFKRLHKEL